MNPGQHRLGVFAKHWEPGQVKTRLATSIGNEPAAAIYQMFVRTVLLRLCDYGNTLELVITPDTQLEAFQIFLGEYEGLDRWSVRPQGAGDLGQRMQRFFVRAVDEACASAILIGTDSPTIPLDYFELAHQLLQEKDVVLGPTDDGGYYLVAARNHVPPIFDDIDWSTDQVWPQTLAKLDQHKLDLGVLPVWYDVDEIDDLARLRAEIADTDLVVMQDLERDLNLVMNSGQR